jgi:hypothetical protein
VKQTSSHIPSIPIMAAATATLMSMTLLRTTNMALRAAVFWRAVWRPRR